MNIPQLSYCNMFVEKDKKLSQYCAKEDFVQNHYVNELT